MDRGYEVEGKDLDLRPYLSVRGELSSGIEICIGVRVRKLAIAHSCQLLENQNLPGFLANLALVSWKVKARS